MRVHEFNIFMKNLKINKIIILSITYSYRTMDSLLILFELFVLKILEGTTLQRLDERIRSVIDRFLRNNSMETFNALPLTHTEWYSTVQYSTIQYSAVHYCTVLRSIKTISVRKQQYHQYLVWYGTVPKYRTYNILNNRTSDRKSGHLNLF